MVYAIIFYEEVMIMKTVININNLSEMKALAQAMSQHLYAGFVLCLEGDLGAGKTTFTQFLGQAMGIQDPINSPTFTILKLYENKLPLYHIDAYRLEGVGSDQELEEYIYGDGVCVVEWYSYIHESIPSASLKMKIEWLSEEGRKVTLEGTDEYEKIVESLSH